MKQYFILSFLLIIISCDNSLESKIDDLEQDVTDLEQLQNTTDSLMVEINNLNNLIEDLEDSDQNIIDSLMTEINELVIELNQLQGIIDGIDINYYPIHYYGSSSVYVFDGIDDSPTTYYIGINFETSTRWNLGDDYSDIDNNYYDIILEYNYHQTTREVRLHSGNNGMTKIYLIDNISTLQEITELPTNEQLVNLISWDELDGEVCFMIKNRYDRWTKLKLSEFSSQLMTDFGTPYSISYFHQLEWFYYKHHEPDLTIH